jgi:WD40 repeat protein
MRRVLSSAMVASGLVALIVGGGPADAAPAPAPSGAGGQAAAAGKKTCTIKDERLRELSGMIATAKGYIVINDSTDVSGNKPVFFLDKACKFVESVSFPSEPRDPEDLALSPDGKTIWIADIGDNANAPERRTRVALWSMPVDGSTKPVLHRISYPQTKPHDAEALLIADDGSPIIITKTGSKAEIFTPSAPLKKNNDTPVPLRQVGEISLPKTTTTTILGAGGRLTVTGAARSPDGKRVALRTYADAFEWDVSGGDIVKALTTGKPRVTALADQFGEAIAYTPDGKTFVTVSDAQVIIQSYTPATTVADAAVAGGGAQAADQSWTSKLSLQDINYLIGAVGVIGAILVGVGIYGIVRARRSPPKEPAGADGDGGRKTVRGSAQPPTLAAGRAQQHPGYREPGRDADGFEPAGQGQRPSLGVYGGGAGSASPAGGGYGGAPAAPRPGGVYGAKPGGGVYGGGAAPANPGRGVYGGALASGAGDGGGGGRAPSPGGVYGGAPSGRRPAPSGGAYDLEPASGGYGGGGRPDGDYGHPGRGGRHPEGGRRDDEDGYDDNRAGAHGQQPRGRRGAYPDNGDGYR